MRKILVVAVHPDDETLGCGGTLQKHKAEGHQISWLICTSIKTEHGYSQQQVDVRSQEISAVAGRYQFDKTCQLGLAPTRVDVYPMSDLVNLISAVFNEVAPDTVYLPFKGDVHSDHRKIFEAAYSCTKSFRYPFIKKILMMETLSETEFAPSTREDSFIPNVFVNISPYFKQKCEILHLYKNEIGTHPFPRSEGTVTALATLRGASAGCEYAESFMLLKQIE